MKPSTSKLFALLLILMIMLSDASSTFRKRLSSRRRSKSISDSLKGFLVGFFLELTNQLPLKDFFSCAFQDITFNIHNHNLEIIGEKMKIPENYDDSSMDEMNNAGIQARLHVLPKTTLHPRNTAADSTDIFEHMKNFFNNLPATLQRISDKTHVLSKQMEQALEIFNNKYLFIAMELLCCLMVSGSSETDIREAEKTILEKLASIFGKLYDLKFFISKYYQISGDISSLIDNINRHEVDDYEKYQILGRSVASIVRVILKANGMFLTKRFR